jgi:hypothetical protein
MLDAVGLIGKTIEIDLEKYTISNLHYIPGTDAVWVSLSNEDYNMNIGLDRLIPLLKEQYAGKRN